MLGNEYDKDVVSASYMLARHSKRGYLISVTLLIQVVAYA